jgi:hypothetical protein
MNRLLALLILSLCYCHSYAQRTSLANNDIKPLGLGLYAGYTNTVSVELFKDEDIYNTPILGVSFSMRPLKHMQLSLNVDHGLTDIIGAAAVSMTFPIGKGLSYFYPGWHLIYIGAGGQPMAGIGAILGGNIALTDRLSLNIQGDGSILILGSRLSLSTGLIAKF